MGGKAGCLFLLAIFLVLSGEVFFAWWLGSQEFAEDLGGVLGTLIALAVLSFIGYRLVKWRASKMQNAFMTGQIGRAAAAIFGAALIVFPGFITGVLGLLLQLGPIQAMVAGLTQKIFMNILAKNAGRMMGGAGGMPGGMPGGQMNPADLQKAMEKLQEMQAQGKDPMKEMQKMQRMMAQAQKSPFGGRPPIPGGGKGGPRVYDMKK